jgi:endogenous inhibitor of DNA gyrase (YacG/DUF329 family)
MNSKQTAAGFKSPCVVTSNPFVLVYPWNHMKYHCPICKKPTDSDANADFPFCSERCKLLDLGAWASEKYVISEPVIDESTSENSNQEADDERN